MLVLTMSVCLCGGWVISLECSALEVEEPLEPLEPDLQVLACELPGFSAAEPPLQPLGPGTLK